MMGTLRQGVQVPLVLLGLVILGPWPGVGGPAGIGAADGPSRPPTTRHADVTVGGGCGITVTPFAAADAGLAGVVRLVAAGARLHALSYDGKVLGLDELGRPDPEFGRGGVATAMEDIAAAVGRDSGELLVASQTFSGPRRVELLQLSATGRPDVDFGTNGRVTVPLGGSADGSAYAIFLEVVGTDVLVISRNDTEVVAAWIRPDGSLRPGFGTAGVTRFSASDAYPLAATVMPSGRTVVVGVRDSSTSVVWRLTSGGELDTSFGTGGMLVADERIGTQAVHPVAEGVLAFADATSGGRPTGTIDLSNGDVTVASERLPTEGIVRYVGDRLVAAASRGGFFVEGGELATTRRTLTGAVDASYGTSGTTRMDPHRQVRLAVSPSVTIHGDGAVSAVGLATDWDGTETVVRLHVQPDGDPTAAHGWCPDDDRPGTPRVARLSGPDRYATAVALSREAYPEGADHVVVATGSAFPDALAGGPFAAQLRAPVLLVGHDSVPDVVADELQRLDPTRLTVLGGPTAITDTVVQRLGSIAGVVPMRLSGGDRYATAVQISRFAFNPGVPIAFVSTGENFPDALAAGAVAGTLGGPVLLVTRGGVPDATMGELARLDPREIVVMGGDAAVGDTYDVLADRFGSRVSLVAGGDRYETARLVNARYRDEHDGANGRPVTTVFIATGENFPDALAGAAVAGTAGGVISLVEPRQFDERVRHYLGRVHPRTIYVLGGEVAVGPVWVDVLRQPSAVSWTYIEEPVGPSSPVRWNSCEPVRWVFNPEGAPAGGERMMKEGLAMVTRATGWQFEFVGQTDEPVLAGNREPYQPGRYGDQWAPVLMGWTQLGFTAGQGGSTWVDGVSVTGELGLDRRLDLPTTFEEGGWGDLFLHEVGHVLGLGHPGDPRQTMYWTTLEDVSGLRPGDIAGLERLRQGGCIDVPPPVQTLRFRTTQSARQN